VSCEEKKIRLGGFEPEIGLGSGVIQPNMIDPDITGLDISRFQLPLPRITESFRFYGLRKPWRRGKQTIAVGNFKP